jgi:hypothetical protein
VLCNYSSFLSLQNFSNLVLGRSVEELNFGVFALTIVHALDINDIKSNFVRSKEIKSRK